MGACIASRPHFAAMMRDAADGASLSHFARGLMLRQESAMGMRLARRDG